ncbi:MAG: transglycosylase domain-containing protein [Actinomycetota bacterium]
MDPNIHEAHRQDRRRRRLPGLILLAVLAIVGAAWIGLFGFLGSTAALGTVEDLEDRYFCDISNVDLSFPDVSRLSSVATSDGVELGKLSERNSQPLPLDEMPDLVVGALLSAEDKSFYEHEGVDFKAIVRAAVGGGETGASTITQQVVKSSFLTPDRTLERKICEAQVAAELERRYTKDQILEFYANSVFFGSNAYGVQAAAQEYFGKDLDELTLAEAATLVTPIRNPTFYHPRQNPQNSIAVRNRTIDRMVANGFATPAEGEAAKNSPLGVIPHSSQEQLDPQVMSAVLRELLDNDGYNLGDSYAERKRALFGCPASEATCLGGGGLEIEITVDHDLQTEATRILKSWFRPEYNDITGAIATVENGTGAIRVIASGVDYGDDIEAGQRPYDLANLSYQNAGSAFKPFTLAAALENGDLDNRPVTLGSLYDRSSPVEIPLDNGTTWTVENAGGNAGHDLQTLESATYNSTNTVYARLIDAVGPDTVVDTARRLGLTSPHLKPFHAITLGAASVTPLEMAAAYSTFANQGLRADPYLIEKIIDSEGNVVYEHENRPEQVLSPTIASVVVSTLEKVVSQGTGRRADIGRPQAGKTGTATDHTDVWFAGFIPQLTTTVWVGHPDHPAPMERFTLWNDVEGAEQSIKRAYGGTVAAPVWRQFMEYATQNMAVRDFPEEPTGANVYRATPRTVVPELDGLTEDQMADAVYAAHLKLAIVDVPSSEPEGRILDIIPRSGTGLQQGSTVNVLVSSGVPEPALAPNLVGMPLDDVSNALREFRDTTGIQVAWTVEHATTNNPNTWGVVIATDPPAGSLVEDGGSIKVTVGRKPGNG